MCEPQRTSMGPLEPLLSSPGTRYLRERCSQADNSSNSAATSDSCRHSARFRRIGPPRAISLVLAAAKKLDSFLAAEKLRARALRRKLHKKGYLRVRVSPSGRSSSAIRVVITNVDAAVCKQSFRLPH